MEKNPDVKSGVQRLNPNFKCVCCTYLRDSTQLELIFLSPQSNS